MEGNRSGTRWRIYEIHRNAEYLIGQFESKELGLAALYILCHHIFSKEPAADSLKQELRRAGDLHTAAAILKNALPSNYISLDAEQNQAINLEKYEENYHVYYLSSAGKKIYLTKQRPFQGAMITLYSCSLILQKIDMALSRFELVFSSGQKEEIVNMMMRR